jgi:hypothetical protein
MRRRHPGTPPSRMPWPPSLFCSSCAAMGGIMRPAIWLAAARTGRWPSIILDGFVGDSRHLRWSKIHFAGMRNRKVQEAAEDVPLLQEVELRQQSAATRRGSSPSGRRPLPPSSTIWRARRPVTLVLEAAALTGVALDVDAMALPVRISTPIGVRPAR